MDNYTDNHLKRIQGFMDYYSSYIDSALSGHVSGIKFAELLSQMIVSFDNGFLDDVKELEKHLYAQAEKKGEIIMNNINWDKWFEDDSESMPNCLWIDHEPFDDGTYYGDDDEEEE